MIPVLNNQDDSWKVSATPFFFVVHVRMTNFPTWNVVQEQKFSWTSSHTFRKGVFGIFLGGANTFRVCSKGLEFWVPRPNKKWLKNVGSRWIMMFFTDSKHCGLVLKPDLEDQKHPVDEKLKHEFRISIHSSMLGESASPQKICVEKRHLAVMVSIICCLCYPEHVFPNFDFLVHQLQPGRLTWNLRIHSSMGTQNHEIWRFCTPNIWVIIPKNEGFGFWWLGGGT